MVSIKLTCESNSTFGKNSYHAIGSLSISWGCHTDLKAIFSCIIFVVTIQSFHSNILFKRLINWKNTVTEWKICKVTITLKEVKALHNNYNCNHIVRIWLTFEAKSLFLHKLCRKIITVFKVHKSERCYDLNMFALWEMFLGKELSLHFFLHDTESC